MINADYLNFLIVLKQCIFIILFLLHSLIQNNKLGCLKTNFKDI